MRKSPLVVLLVGLLLACEVSAKLYNIGWTRPVWRQNCQVLNANEIGGYEFRVYSEATKKFVYYKINMGVELQDINAMNYSYMLIVPDAVKSTYVQMAAFDKNGLYSRFVGIPGTGAPVDNIVDPNCQPKKPSKPLNLRAR